jgi:Ankyrin repeats (3 copies)
MNSEGKAPRAHGVFRKGHHMTRNRGDDDEFQAAVKELIAGDFSRLAPLFAERPEANDRRCRIIDWYEANLFADEAQALNEALSCACFNGCTSVVEYLLAKGVDPTAGDNTGLDGIHWAANRGQLDVVNLLIQHQAPLETRNMHDTTVLGTAVWSALNESKPDHLEIIAALIKAGARTDDVGYPSGDKNVDEVFRRLGVSVNDA